LSHQTSSQVSGQADLLEKIKQAELQSTATLDASKKEADGILQAARENANNRIRQAENTARAEREQLLAAAKAKVQAEIATMEKDNDLAIQRMKDKSKNPPDLKKLVFSLLEE
jgi:vacuolar-type H+-ATPase subunit H